MKQFKCAGRTTTSLALSLTLACAMGLLLFEPTMAQPSSEPVIYLDQAWSQADREMYYQIPQGSQVISYDIFLNLEAAGSQETVSYTHLTLPTIYSV